MRYFSIVTLCLFVLLGCRKENNPANVPANNPSTPSGDTSVKIPRDTSVKVPQDTGNKDTVVIPPVVADSFVSYIIKAGNNYCEKNGYPASNVSSVRFRAILDSSCIYTTKDPLNQEDINKLWGIGDCGSHHQSNSARVGWNWVRDSMRIHAYCYAGAQRKYKELGTVAISKAFECKITVLPGKYVFELNGKTDTMTRGCGEPSAKGYKLLPYFGGDEPSPHDMKVRIREL